MATTGTCHFLSFSFDFERDELQRNGTPVKLRPKTLALLRAFLQRPGKVLPKNELMRLVWPGLAVTDVVLNVCVAELRRALGDTAAQPRCVATAHRRGFRFIAPITSEQPAGEQVAVASSPAAGNIFVGRRGELETLVQCWRRAQAGQMQVVVVSGDTGVGKTALVDRFLAEFVGDSGGRFICGRGECLDLHAATEPFMPVLEALRAICDGPAGARVAELIRRYAPSWRPHLPSDSGAEEELSAGKQGHESMVRELVATLNAIAQEAPVVLVLEDLHWSDPSTVDLLTVLAQQRGPARLLLIATWRPADAILQDHPRRLQSLAVAARGRVREIEIELLGEESVRQYLERRLGDVETAAALAPAVTTRTDGSPLFMVALVDHLVDEGILQKEGDRWRVTRPLTAIARHIPPSVTRLLREQIATFGARERAALAAACVAGFSFASQAVAAGMECSLEEAESLCADLAERRRFLVDGGPIGWPDGSVGQNYQFRHMLYRQVVDGLLTGGQRQALHLRIGTRLERGFADCVGDAAGTIAAYFHAAGDHQRALKYSKLAGRRAMERSAYQESIGHMRAAHAALRLLPAGDARDREELGLLTYLGPLLVAVRGVGDSEAAALATRMRELARRTHQQMAQLATYARSTVVWRTRGEIEIADAIAHEVLVLAEDLGEETLLLSAHSLIGGNRFHCADFESARSHLGTALEIADRRDDIRGNLVLESTAAAVRCQLAVTRLLGGEADAARRDVEAALARHGTSELATVRAIVNSLAAWVFILLGEVDRVNALTGAVLEIESVSSLPLWAAVARSMRGWASVQCGRGDEGLADVETGFAEYVASQGEASSFDYQVLRADAYRCAGRYGDAMRVVDEGMETLARFKQMYFAAEMYGIRGALLAAEPVRATSAAEECWHEGLTLARKQKAPAFELRLATLLARSMMSAGRDVAASRLLRPLLGRVERGGETPDVITARALLAAMKP